jgi:hypothetical protein
LLRNLLEDNMKDMIIELFGIILAVFIFVGMFWIVKNGSYLLWYEDMVEDTIKEVVKQECLNI